MICMLLALGVVAFWVDAPEEWINERNVRAAMKSFGILCAVGVLLLGSCSILETNSATDPWAFRRGQLKPTISENSSGNPEVVVFYLQKSWWNWKKDGEWPCLYDPNRGWVYWDKKTLRDVPSEVYEESETPNTESDNRGTYEP